MLVNGDCLEEVQKLVDKGIQVDSIVTDPPYHLTSIVERFGKEGSAPAKDKDGAFQRQSKGFMGKEWDGGDIAFRQETWGLFMKVLKPGGHLLAFSGSRTYHRMAVAIEDAGFDIRDQIMWLYGSGFPKSHNLGDGWGTALKPAHEPIVLARKKIEGTNKQNREKYGTAGLNIDACRIEYADENDRSGWHKTGGGGKGYMDTDTFKIREISPEEIQERTKDGRFPANVMHDGSDVVKDVFPNAKDEGSAARYFYCPKTSKAEKNQGLDNFEIKKRKGGGGTSNNTWYEDDVNAASGKFGSEKAPSKNIHPTVKPQKLMQYLCRMVTPKGGIVLDMFMGSGSTGMAAKDEGFDFIGIEKEKEYFKIAEARIESVEVKATLQEFME